MKTLRNLLLLLLSFLTSTVLAQPCIPDTSQTVAGLYPSTAVNIPGGCEGEFYQTSITLVVPVDTTVFGFLYTVDSAVLMNLNGLPAGLSYTCTPPNCVWLGGSYGCILISGVLPPGSAGSYTLSFDFSYFANGILGPISVPQSFPNYYVLNVNTVPFADFTCQLTCATDPVAFTDLSSPNTTSWLWDFGNGMTSLQQNPSIQYASPGNYLICLVASNECGADTFCKSITIPGFLNAHAGPDLTIYLGNSATIGGAPSASGGTPPYSYVWLPSSGLDNQFIANPVTSTIVDISYVLFVTDSAGCSAQDTVYVHVDTTSCDTVSNLWTSNIGFNRAKLNWIPVNNAYGYIIRGREVGATLWRTVLIPNGHPNHRTVFGLMNNTTYEWQIMAQCDEEGNLTSAWSDLTSFTTGCFTPDSIWETNVLVSSATLNWSPVVGVAGYEVNGRILGSPTWQVKFQGPYFNFKTVNNLTPGFTYEWRVRSICLPDSVVSPWSAVSVFNVPPFARFGNQDSPNLEKNNNIIEVFPNPVSTSVNVHVKTKLAENGESWVSIQDAVGKAFIRKRLTEDFTKLNISMSELENGLYFLVVENAGEFETRKLVVSK